MRPELVEGHNRALRQAQCASAAQAGRGLRLLVAGPSNTVPSAAKREPCSGQSQDFSKSLKRTIPPRWVQTADSAHVLAVDGRDRDRLTPLGADNPCALGRRTFVILERVQLGFQPAFRSCRPDGSVFPQESDGARRLTDSSPQRPRPGRYASQDLARDP
jgi:hypothetical protein